MNKATRSNILAVILSIAFISAPFIASAQSTVDISIQIQNLLDQVKALQARLSSLQVSASGNVQSGTGSSIPAVFNNAPPGGKDPTVTTLHGEGCTGTQCPLPDVVSLFSSNGGVPGTTVTCPVFPRRLQYGMRGDDVRSLQNLLVKENLLPGEPTGFFGVQTQGAVQQLQAKLNIVSSGDPISTGWGTVGQATIAGIGRMCEHPGIGRPTPTCTPRPACLDATPRCLIPETTDMCPKAHACTRDAKVCPDGSAVGRTGPRCEFVCPGTGNTGVTGTTTVQPGGTTSGKLNGTDPTVLPDLDEVNFSGSTLPGEADFSVPALPRPTGSADTTNACNGFWRNLSNGSQGDDVSQLQHVLVAKGFLSQANVTGFFGPLTRRALTKFQTQSGITAAGVLGPITRIFLQNHCDQTVTTPDEDTFINTDDGTVSNADGNTVPGSAGGSDGSTTTSTDSNNGTLTASPTSGTAPLHVIFLVSVDWSSAYTLDFGDGASGALQNNCPGGLIGACGQPTSAHTYTTAGTYTAALIQTSPGGCGPNADPRCLGAPGFRKVLGSVVVTARASSAGTGQIVVKTGERIDHFVVTKINADSVEGLMDVVFPVARPTGVPKTLHIGDDIGFACEGISEKLNAIGFQAQTATFTKVISKPPLGGCPI